MAYLNQKSIIKSFLIFLIVSICSCSNDSGKKKLLDSEIKTAEESAEKLEPINKQKSKVEFEILDSLLHSVLVKVKLSGQFHVAYSHTPYLIKGLFNNDEILDSAFLIINKLNKKEGLLIRIGEGAPHDYVIFGAGEKVLGQAFDDLSWVGQFKTIPKGTKTSSNVDKYGDIITREIPDSMKIALPHDGVFIHTAEGCGGGIIYFDNNKYNWIQQE